MKSNKLSRKRSLLIAELLILAIIVLNMIFFLYKGKTKSALAAQTGNDNTQELASSDAENTETDKDSNENGDTSNVLTDSENSKESASDSESADSARTSTTTNTIYSLYKVVDVEARQGLCATEDYYYVSSSKSLAKYDKNWNLISENDDPFASGFEAKVNHIGDIDVSGNEIYCIVEKFSKGSASDLQIAVYDTESLQLLKIIPIGTDSGQTEGAGICVNEDANMLISCQWGQDETAKYLYEYDLTNGSFLGKIYMSDAPSWIQGITYYQGAYYISSDDGDADSNMIDHIYKVDLSEDGNALLTEVKGVAEVAKQGEIEGISFDEKKNQLLLLYNYGQRIVNGIKQDFYDGYDEEQHQIYIYTIHG
jgi:5-oxoprolinase (ATP-hydrolysing) subunit C